MLLDFAYSVKGDLIAIMTQQEKDFTEYFVGTVAKRIIHSSDIPVLSIVPK